MRPSGSVRVRGIGKNRPGATPQQTCRPSTSPDDEYRRAGLGVSSWASTTTLSGTQQTIDPRARRSADDPRRGQPRAVSKPLPGIGGRESTAKRDRFRRCRCGSPKTTAIPMMSGSRSALCMAGAAPGRAAPVDGANRSRAPKSAPAIYRRPMLRSSLLDRAEPERDHRSSERAIGTREVLAPAAKAAAVTDASRPLISP